MSGPGAGMTGWQYTCRQWDPERDGDEEAWARAVAAQGWRTWLDGPGAWATSNSRRVRVWSLRRPCNTPFSVHDHDTRCAPAEGGTDRTEAGCPTTQVG